MINHPSWKEGDKIPRIQYELDAFYLIRPAKQHVEKSQYDDLFVVKVTGLPEYISTGSKKKKRSKKSALDNLPPMMQFYRSFDPCENPKARTYLPVWKDAQKNEVWDDKIDPVNIKSHSKHIPWCIQTHPRGVLDIPFDLIEREIPAKIWRELERSGVSLSLVGAPPPGRSRRGKITTDK
jgi:hypothetical protein